MKLKILMPAMSLLLINALPCVSSAREIRHPNCKIAIQQTWNEAKAISEVLQARGFFPYLTISVIETSETLQLRPMETDNEEGAEVWTRITNDRNGTLAQGTTYLKESTVAQDFAKSDIRCTIATTNLSEEAPLL
jgi:predicted ATPase with chaperone activity